MDIPVLVAPMAMQGMAHSGAEPAAARAAAKCGVPYASHIQSFILKFFITYTPFFIYRIDYMMSAWIQNPHPPKTHLQVVRFVLMFPTVLCMIFLPN